MHVEHTAIVRSEEGEVVELVYLHSAVLQQQISTLTTYYLAS